MIMNSSNSKHFYSKLLLFGEYSILDGGSALTIPFSKFSGYLDFPSSAPGEFALQSNAVLKDYLHYLQKTAMAGELHLEKLKSDIDNGLYFNSTIPQGYGAGSSGALVAALLNSYGDGSHAIDDLTALRKKLSMMESYFHGSSSGLDPLSCFLGKPLHVAGTGEIKVLPGPLKLFKNKISVFLADTAQTAATAPLIDWYKQHIDQAKKHEMKEYSDGAINALLRNDDTAFMEMLTGLSAFQLSHLTPMIPNNIRELWQAGLSENTWTMKLCGSGGGGFMLAFGMDAVPFGSAQGT
jgi:mevalonate kinase